MKFNIKNLFNKKSIKKLEKATLVGVASLALIIPLGMGSDASVHADYVPLVYNEKLNKGDYQWIHSHTDKQLIQGGWLKVGNQWLPPMSGDTMNISSLSWAGLVDVRNMQWTGTKDQEFAYAHNFMDETGEYSKTGKYLMGIAHRTHQSLAKVYYEYKAGKLNLKSRNMNKRNHKPRKRSHSRRSHRRHTKRVRNHKAHKHNKRNVKSHKTLKNKKNRKSRI